MTPAVGVWVDLDPPIDVAGGVCDCCNLLGERVTRWRVLVPPATLAEGAR